MQQYKSTITTMRSFETESRRINRTTTDNVPRRKSRLHNDSTGMGGEEIRGTRTVRRTVDASGIPQLYFEMILPSLMVSLAALWLIIRIGLWARDASADKSAHVEN